MHAADYLSGGRRSRGGGPGARDIVGAYDSPLLDPCGSTLHAKKTLKSGRVGTAAPKSLRFIELLGKGKDGGSVHSNTVGATSVLVQKTVINCGRHYGL
jgi:hypothetical protein